MKKNVLWKRYGKWTQIMFTAILFICAGATLHDMQTAEGAGLYLSIQAGAADRGMYDLLVDAAGMLCLLLLLLLPCILLKHLQIDAFLRFSSACLAFLPVASIGSLVHLMDGTNKIVFEQAALGKKLWENATNLFPFLTVGIPLLILLFAAIKFSEASDEECEERKEKTGPLRKVLPAVPVMPVLLFITAAMFPVLTDSCIYLIIYIFLVYGFSLWEKLLKRNPELNSRSWFLFGIFWLRGIERMLELMSVYHL